MSRQQGMTFIGTLFILAVYLFMGLMIMRAVPVYIKHYSIIQSVKQLDQILPSQLTGDEMADIFIMRESLSKRLYINGVYNFDMNKVEFKHLTGNQYEVSLKYTEVSPLFYNMSLLYDFSDTVKINPGSGSISE